MKLQQTYIVIYAILCGCAGLCLLFVPDEVANRLGAPGSLAVSLWGCALLGFASMNWVARHALLGGIYGRSLIVGNQVHSLTGCLIWLKYLINTNLTLLSVGMLAIYVYGCALFSLLMFRRPNQNS